MFGGLVQNLLDMYEQLDSHRHRLADAVRKDALPMFLPDYTGEPGKESEMAIASMIQIWHLNIDEAPLLSAGVVCASPSTVAAAKQLNEAKGNFKRAVAALRGNDTKTKLDHLVERAMHKEGERGGELLLAMRRARLGQLNLKRCYAQVLVLPAGLTSISFTWATTHSVIESITVAQATKMAEKLQNDETRKTVIDLLSEFSPGDQLAYKKKLPNQLCANLISKDGDDLRKKSVTISGVVIHQGDTLPYSIWRSDPGKARPRVPRHDLAIESEPYIKALCLHRYLAPRKKPKGDQDV